MKPIILDSSGLTELKQASLLIPLLLVKSPVLLCDVAWATCSGIFSREERKVFEGKGLVTRELDGKQVEDVFRLFQLHSSMTRCNCFSFILASSMPQSILISNCQETQSVAASRDQNCKPLSWAWKNLTPA